MHARPAFYPRAPAPSSASQEALVPHSSACLRVSLAPLETSMGWLASLTVLTSSRRKLRYIFCKLPRPLYSVYMAEQLQRHSLLCCLPGAQCVSSSSVRSSGLCWCPCGAGGCWAGLAFFLLRSVLKYTAPSGASVEQVHFLNLCRIVTSPPEAAYLSPGVYTEAAGPVAFVEVHSSYSCPIALLPSFFSPAPCGLHHPPSMRRMRRSFRRTRMLLSHQVVESWCCGRAAPLR